MSSINQATVRRTHCSLARTVRYERSFLLDLKNLNPASRERVQKFVFEDFAQIAQLHHLPEFRRLGSSEIFYRFSIERYLVSLEITGQIVKFLRILPKPEV